MKLSAVWLILEIVADNPYRSNLTGIWESAHSTFAHKGTASFTYLANDALDPFPELPFKRHLTLK